MADFRSLALAAAHASAAAACTFAKAAADYSQEIETARLGGDMGWFAADAYGPKVQGIIDGLKKHKRKAVLVLNKIDQVKERERLLAKTAEINALGGEDGETLFTDTFMISAEHGDGVLDLVAELGRRMPKGPHHYPEDHITDAPQRFLAAEITREHLFRQLHEEVPYALTVETESWEEFKDGSVKITQVIFVAKEGQKAIVIGKGGAKIKTIREAAQREMQQAFERHVHLFLFIKVRGSWADDPERFREMGLDFEE